MRIRICLEALYAMVDKKKGGSGNDLGTSLSATEDHLPYQLPEDIESPMDKTKEAEEEKEATSSSETAVDQLYAQVDKKKQKSIRRRRCVLRSQEHAVYSVVNKPSPPQVPTKSQQLLEELANDNNISYDAVSVD